MDIAGEGKELKRERERERERVRERTGQRREERREGVAMERRRLAPVR